MPKRHLVALWFADIAGYILQEEARTAIRQHDGRIVKFLGDAVLAEFPSTELAVRAGVSLSRSYAVRSADTGQAHELRIGVHVDDVAVGAEGDIYGDGVNLGVDHPRYRLGETPRSSTLPGAHRANRALLNARPSTPAIPRLRITPGASIP